MDNESYKFWSFLTFLFSVVVFIVILLVFIIIFYKYLNTEYADETPRVEFTVDIQDNSEIYGDITISGENITIDWGDDIVESNLSGENIILTHKYNENKSYNVKIISNNLQKLSLEDRNNTNNMTSIEFYNLVKLNDLIFGATKVSNLNLSGLTSLTIFICLGNNLLPSLNLSGLTTLTTFACSGNNLLSNLNLSGLTSLTDFECSDNNSLTSLNLSGLTSLINFTCTANNSLPSLNLSGLTSLTNLSCLNNNSLSDVSIETISFSNNISLYINLSDCDLNEDTVNKLLVYIDTNRKSIAGSINLSGGTNNAPTTGPPNGFEAVSDLTTNGWTVNTN